MSCFNCQDLFGGEEVLVKTATAATERIKIVTRVRAEQKVGLLALGGIKPFEGFLT